MDWQALIKSQPSLACVPPALRMVMEHCKMETGETLFRIGDRVQGMFCVITGEVRLIRHDQHGAQIVLQRSRGGFIAEASLGSKVYHCDAVAAEAGAVLRFPAQKFRASLDENALFRDAWITHLASEVRKLRAQCERLSLNSAAERIIHYIESEGVGDTISLNQSRKAWAVELGLTHETLYRTLRRLQEDGTLDIDGARIAIVQMQ